MRPPIFRSNWMESTPVGKISPWFQACNFWPLALNQLIWTSLIFSCPSLLASNNKFNWLGPKIFHRLSRKYSMALPLPLSLVRRSANTPVRISRRNEAAVANFSPTSGISCAKPEFRTSSRVPTALSTPLRMKEGSLIRARREKLPPSDANWPRISGNDICSGFSIPASADFAKCLNSWTNPWSP